MGRRLAAVVALLSCSALVTACAAISGLDAFSKGDCSGGDCDGGAADATMDSTGGGHVPDANAIEASGDAQQDAAPEAASDAPGSADEGTDARLEAGDAATDAPDDSQDAEVVDGGHGDAAEAGGGGDGGDGGDGGCGPVNTTSNCSACGVACVPTNASAAACNGLTCSYTCMANHSDCNGAKAPDTDGCECATPSCCDAGCQTSHSTGTGASYYDCNPLKTYSVVTATEACTAYALSVNGSATDCSDGWSCNNKAPYTVCYGQGTNCATFCWGYTGTQAGVLYTCACPDVDAGSWN